MTLQILHGSDLIATHRMGYQKGQMITNPEHFRGIPRPAYPSGVRAIRELFLVQFPRDRTAFFRKDSTLFEKEADQES